jgi:hypothetical protein
VEIQRRANYDRDNGAPDPLKANNPIQATELYEMHDIKLRRRAQYDQGNGAPDNLYVFPTTHDLGSISGAISNFPTFSRHLKTIRYLKDFKHTMGECEQLKCAVGNP